MSMIKTEQSKEEVENGEARPTPAPLNESGLEPETPNNHSTIQQSSNQ